MVTLRNITAGAALPVLLFIATSAQAQTPAAAAPTQAAPTPAEPPTSIGPRLHHAPVSIATAHQDIDIEARIDSPQLVKRAILIYRVEGDPAIHETEFKRSEQYVAIIPGKDVTWPSVEYSIEIERLDGTRMPVFASRDHMHRVEVPEDLMDVRERALDQRLGGRRSVFAASAEYVSFGKSDTSATDPVTGQTTSINDNYYRVEGSYTYRPLRTITEFSLKIGVVRGHSPVSVDDTKDIASRYDVGLNYGAPTVTVRLADLFHMQGEFLTSVTEVGFSMGGGGELQIGDPYGAKLVLGFESVQVFGTRVYSRMDLVAGSRLRISPMLEVTDMPHANKFGVRLLGELGYDLGSGFSVAARGGYQARKAVSGGPSFGGTLAYAF